MQQANRLRARAHRTWVAGASLGLFCACFVDLGPERVLETTDPQPSGGGQGGAGLTQDTTNTSTSGGAGDGAGGRGAGGEGEGGHGGDGGGGAPGDCSGEKVLWVRQLGSSFREFATSTAPDGAGGLFVTGLFYGTLDLGGDPLQSGGFGAPFLARFDGSGEHVWSISLTVSAAPVASMFLTAAPNGEFMLTGSFNGSVDFGDGSVTANGEDAVVARYDGDGVLLWKNVYGGAGIQTIRGAAIDPVTGDIYLSGVFHNELDLGGTPFVNGGGTDGFIARLDAAGEHVWSRQMIGAAPDYANGVALDADGNVVAGGWADGDVDLGDGVLTSAGDGFGDAWAALYDSESGDPIWTRLWNDPENEAVRRVTTDIDGSPVIAGKFDNHIALDSFSADFPKGVFVARLGADGIATEAATIGNGLDVAAVRRKGNGNLLVSGAFYNLLGTDVVPIFAAGDVDGMVVELDEDLVPVRTIVVGSTGYDDFGIVSVSEDGLHAFVTATFHGTASLTDCRAYDSMGDTDILLVKLAP